MSHAVKTNCFSDLKVAIQNAPCIHPLKKQYFRLSSNTILYTCPIQYVCGETPKNICGAWRPWDGIHQSFLVPSIFLLSFLPAPNSSAVYLVARAWKFLPTLSESPILLAFFQEILVRNLVCSLG
jgi:hypothetical protein